MLSSRSRSLDDHAMSDRETERAWTGHLDGNVVEYQIFVGTAEVGELHIVCVCRGLLMMNPMRFEKEKINDATLGLALLPLQIHCKVHLGNNTAETSEEINMMIQIYFATA